MTEERLLPIDTVADHGDEWIVKLIGGDEMCVPQDTRNKDARAVLQWIQAGNSPDTGEVSRRRRIRRRLHTDPLWSALVDYLADELGHTAVQVRQGILSKL